MKSKDDYHDKGLIGLIELMDLLRSPGGCPWDAEQTHQSLAEYLLEETYEVLEAINSGDYVHLKEELGDLLLQVIFHSRIAEENPTEGFDVNQVANDLIAKLISRHPHVFNKEAELGADQVKKNWEQIKAEEKKRSSAFDGVPKDLPALLFASKILTRLEKYKPEYKNIIEGQIVELINDGTTQEELGEILFQIVQQSKKLRLEPEIALRNRVLKLDLQS
jgi:XTP/dITP diphosphohydrolase